MVAACCAVRRWLWLDRSPHSIRQDWLEAGQTIQTSFFWGAVITMFYCICAIVLGRFAYSGFVLKRYGFLLNAAKAVP